jgi:HSP20 family protein|tara:strand:- start:547 stop:963 length:417 start_codon:yes stop_codon:yes gene_type:complete
MTTQLTPFGTSPFDILFRNFFDTDGDFTPFTTIKLNHPVDMYEANDGFNIDIACVGLTKKDIDLTIEGDILRVEYKKDSKTAEAEYIQRNIVKRAFNFGWRISRRFDLGQLEAKLSNGLLHLFAPLTEDNKPKTVTIK